ncbi:hypothetical protein [Streptomyces sp. ITFR-16]|nr:hypothetical protein [Streptomyces sp. ITFR-16]WNI20786.1 hypothetical protein RLT58_02125 [Streptomyces sp. ITFR-16]
MAPGHAQLEGLAATRQTAAALAGESRPHAVHLAVLGRAGGSERR